MHACKLDKLHWKNNFSDEVKIIYMCFNAGRTSEMNFGASDLVMRDLRGECLSNVDDTFNGAWVCQEALKTPAYNGSTKGSLTCEAGFCLAHNVATTIAPIARARTSRHQHRKVGLHPLRLRHACESCRRRKVSMRTMLNSVKGRGWVACTGFMAELATVDDGRHCINDKECTIELMIGIRPPVPCAKTCWGVHFWNPNLLWHCTKINIG